MKIKKIAQTPQPSTVGLVGQWKLWDQPSNDEIFDYSLNGNTGTWNGTTLLTNGDFVDWADPTVPDGWDKTGTHDVNNFVEEAPADSLHLVSDGTSISIRQLSVTVIGKEYTCTVDVASSVGEGGVKIEGSSVYAPNITATTTFNFTADATWFFIVRRTGTQTTDIVINSVTLHETLSHNNTDEPGVLFDGDDDKIAVPADSSIDANGKTELTISAWINPASDGEGNFGRIVDKQTAGLGYIFNVQSEAGGNVAIRWQVENATDMLAVIAAVVPINIWTHVVVTYDHDDGVRKGKIYIDGVLVANSTTDQAGSAGALGDDSAVVLGIGNRNAEDRTFDGIIGETRIYDRAFTASEAQSDYETTRWRYSV